jgi:macrolide transport system ATP-binding/permease protein
MGLCEPKMPDWIGYVRSNLRLVPPAALGGLRPEREAEIVEDLAQQLEDAYREALEAGASDAKAQEIAEKHVSDWVQLSRELMRTERGKESAMAMWQQQAEDRDVRTRGAFSLLTDFRQDIFYGLRVLRKSPGFTAVAILTLALGIGANTAIFGLIDAVMLRSLPVRDPQHLMLFKWKARKGTRLHSSSSYGDCPSIYSESGASGCSFSFPFMNEMMSQSSIFSSVGAFAGGGRFNISGNGPASLARAQYVSGSYFETLGVRPAVGRVFQPSDDTASAAPVVELSYSYWQESFAGDSGAVGKTIYVAGKPYTIVGVADAQFTSLTPGAVQDLWLPISARRVLTDHWSPKNEDAGSWWIVLVGRLKPGVSVAQAQAGISVIFRNSSTHGDKPVFSDASANPEVLLIPAQSGLVGVRGRFSQPLYMLMGIVGVVLLIACANLAGLMVSRAAARQKEIAIRLAIGAGRARIVRQLLTESVTLAVLGAALGVLMAQWGSKLLATLLSQYVGRTTLALNTRIDLRVLAFTAGVAVLTGIVFGLAPALRGARVDLTPTLKEGIGKSATAGPAKRITAGNLLVVTQVALSVVVLVGAGLLVRTLQNLRSIDPGFQIQNVLNFGVDTTLARAHGVPIDNLFRDLQSQFAALPGVQAVSYTNTILLSGSSMTTSFPAPGKKDGTQSDSYVLPVGPNFFETLRIPMVAGRDFLPEEFAAAAKERGWSNEKTPTPAIVNELFVKKYMAGINPIGQTFGAENHDESKSAGWTIIGIVRDAKYSSLRREVPPTFYIPSGTGGEFQIRSAMNPEAVIPSLRGIAQKLDLPIVEVKTETQQIDELLFQERLVAQLSSFFGVLALVLASIGIYGLLSFEVARRTREIGIRMALGARQGSVVKIVVGQGFVLAVAGAIVGGTVAVSVTRYLKSLLYGVTSSDPVTLVAAFGLLVLVAFAACFVPARRATRVDPLVALRYE